MPPVPHALSDVLMPRAKMVLLLPSRRFRNCWMPAVEFRLNHAVTERADPPAGMDVIPTEPKEVEPSKLSAAWLSKVIAAGSVSVHLVEVSVPLLPVPDPSRMTVPCP